MQRTIAIVCLIVAVGVSGLRAVSAKEAPASEAQLLNEFQSALKARDKDAVLALFNWEGVSPKIRSFLDQWASDLVKVEIVSVKLSPLPQGFRSSFEEGGVRYSANVEPAGIIDVKYAEGHQNPMLLPYGKLRSGFYIAAPRQETIAATQPLPPGTKIVTVHVRTADGRALPNTSVICGDPGAIPHLVLKTLFGGRQEFMTDDKGQLALPIVADTLFLVTASERGFGWIPNGELKEGAELVVQPWGRIEGIRKNRDHLVADEHLSLSLDRDYYRGDVVAPVQFGGTETQTDAQGRFVFETVPPLRFFIDRQEKQRAFWGYFLSVEVNPGESKKLEINTRGRTVLGRLKVSPDLAPNIDLSTCTGALLSNLKDREGSRRSVGFPVAADGTFRADHVEPGDYKITGHIWRKDDHVAMIDAIDVHVPDDTSDAADVPFDMGPVQLKPAVTLKPGDSAPDFATRTLDGLPLKLSDFRGKYVLLDFWATWCGPCVAETPNMKATYDEFGKDARFVMISLSLDEKPEAPQAFAKARDILWTQGFLGQWSNDKVTQKYGVNGIPSIFLIGPDGKIVAADLRGPKIKAAVGAALSK